MKRFLLLMVLCTFTIPIIRAQCTFSNFTSVYALTANDYPYTSPSSGVTVSAATVGITTLSNFTYSCAGTPYNTAAPAWWPNNATDVITLTFSVPVSSFSVVINGTNTNEEFYFNSNTGTNSLSNYCSADFMVTGPGNQLLCTRVSGATGTLITINNATGANQFVLTMNGVGSGSRLTVLDCFVPAGVLPLEMGTFSATYEDWRGGTYLAWETLWESGTREFELQHLAEGKDWEVIGSLPAAGNSGVNKSYEYLHPVSDPGMHQYRIRQIDQNGNFRFSETQTVEVAPAEPTLTLAPNPATGRVTISSGGAAGNLTLYDLYGKVIRRTVIDGTTEMDLSQMAPGIYAVEFSTAGFKISERLVIQ